MIVFKINLLTRLIYYSKIHFLISYFQLLLKAIIEKRKILKWVIKDKLKASSKEDKKNKKYLYN